MNCSLTSDRVQLSVAAATIIEVGLRMKNMVGVHFSHCIESSKRMLKHDIIVGLH